MKFIADLHIHSKYSRATAKNLDLENLYYTAQIKGISLVGTGDFTFPAWIEEIESKLEETEPGIFSLKKQIAREIDQTVPESCRNPVRFILQTEISNIYKKDDRVRKNHNLIYLPDIKTVKKFNARLDAIGNIKSDGRPILGLDARNLLEIVMETNEDGFLIPAHIWTPWFSMFGSKSGFDTIEECFDDLKDQIFAVETGLSSDLPMNWRVAELDHVSLISNSDAHSPGYLGRNASVFNTDLDYYSIRKALETRDLTAFQGTLDMYPDQGKYHYDGHRKCNISLNPAETAELSNICPECGKPLTLGVLHRVQELAIREEGFMPENRQGYTSIIPLADILSEIFGVGPKTKKVNKYYQKAIEILGPELKILTDLSHDKIEKAGVSLLTEAVMRMRKGDIYIDPGFDGEFGKVKIFDLDEKQELLGEKDLLFALPVPGATKNKKIFSALVKKPKPELKQVRPAREPGLLEGLNPDQKQAVESTARAIMIQAGPGTGKTRTLTAKIAFMVSEKTADPHDILALTFTNKAAKELSQRIDAFLPRTDSKVLAATFHGFCLGILKEYLGFKNNLMDDELRLELISNALESVEKENFSGKKWAKKMDRIISLCKQQLLGPEDDLSDVAEEVDISAFKEVYAVFQELCRKSNLVGFEDLIFLCHHSLSTSLDFLSKIQARFQHIFVDEYQDLNFAQYELVKLLAQKSSIVVIGDPNQSIYGFRGSDNKYFKRFTKDYPGCEQILLKQNYRSTQNILDASFQMISKSMEANGSQKIFSNMNTVQKLIVKETSSETSEAVAVGKMIEKCLGGFSFFSMDARSNDIGSNDIVFGDMGGEKEYSFSDFAVLYRTRKQCDAFIKVFEKEGIPFQTADKKKYSDMDGIRQVLSLFRLVTHRAGNKDVKVLLEHFKLKPNKVSANGVFGPIYDPIYKRVHGRDSFECLDILTESLDLKMKIEQDQILGTAYEKLRSLALLYPVPEDFMDALVLNQDPDHLARSAEKVSLMTMHSAKGLEFPVVFVTGCEQGLIPFARDGKTCDNPEEERRLFYVAMTRARDVLCLTYARKRSIYGTWKNQQRSFFIDDIEKRLAQYETQYPKPITRVGEKQRETQLELFTEMNPLKK
ncbi:MAG: DNA helicase [Desulfobacteraceae bacterium 4572_89]|nr:MAG: DNA helicase [Desulfobacteraceae bacterium 4572_89]